MATGRSDYPNQVNNVLGFPFIFRGALDMRATAINEAMKIAAVARAGRAGASENVPDWLGAAYGGAALRVRPRLHHPQAVRPARAAVGGARGGPGRHGERRRGASDVDLDEYRERLESAPGPLARGDARRHPPRQGTSRSASSTPRASATRCSSAAEIVLEEGIPAKPRARSAAARASRNASRRCTWTGRASRSSTSRPSPDRARYVESLHAAPPPRRSARTTHPSCCSRSPNYYAAMMLHLGEVDGVISGPH